MRFEFTENRDQIFSFIQSLKKNYQKEVYKFINNHILLNDLNNVKFYMDLTKKSNF